MVRASGFDSEQALAARQRLERDVPEARVTDYASIVNVMPVDQKHQHVLAAAVIGHAQVIVTKYADEFPDSRIKDFHLEVQSPETFLLDLFGRYPLKVRSCLELMISTVQAMCTHAKDCNFHAPVRQAKDGSPVE